MALLVMVGSIAAFIIAWRVRRRGVRLTVGVILLAIAAVCSILSLLATLVVGALGIGCLIMAVNMPQSEPFRNDLH